MVTAHPQALYCAVLDSEGEANNSCCISESDLDDLGQAAEQTNLAVEGARRRKAALAVSLLLACAAAVWLCKHQSRSTSTAALVASRGNVAINLAASPAALKTFCNSSAPIFENVRPRSFNLSTKWHEKCMNMHHPDTSEWTGRNWCWEWIKHGGCYHQRGDVTWAKSQEYAAIMEKAPHYDVEPLQPLLHPELCDSVASGEVAAASSSEIHQAHKWLEANVAIYVLNLDRDHDRLATFSGRMDFLGLQFQRIEGVDMSIPGTLKAAMHEGLIPSSWNFTKAEETAATAFQGMQGKIMGTVGVAAAHLKTMKHVMTSSKPLTLVFEDDSWLHEDFAVKLHRMVLNEAPCDWEVIALKSRCPYGQCVSKHLSRVIPDANEPRSRCHYGVNWGFYGMLYRRDSLQHVMSRLGPTVWDEENPHCLDVDVALASISDEVAFYAVPSVQQPGFLQEKWSRSVHQDNNLLILPTDERQP